MAGVYRTLGTVFAVAATLAGITHSTEAKAAARKEYVIVLLDRSGTMTEDAYFDGTNHRSKWLEAVTQAASRVEGQRDGKDYRPSSDSTWEDPTYTPPATVGYYPDSSHCYQIWTFEETDYTVRFPTDGSWFCATQADVFTKDTTKYATVINQIKTTVGPANGAPLTPLAHSLCQALAVVREAAQEDPLYGDPNNVQIRRSITMISDGLENNTLSTEVSRRLFHRRRAPRAVAANRPERLSVAGRVGGGGSVRDLRANGAGTGSPAPDQRDSQSARAG